MGVLLRILLALLPQLIWDLRASKAALSSLQRKRLAQIRTLLGRAENEISHHGIQPGEVDEDVDDPADN